jgi:hypothetical protein
MAGDGEFQELAMKKYGVSPKASIFSKVLKRIVIPLVGAIMDTFFLHGGWSLTRRMCVSSFLETKSVKPTKCW